MKRYLLVVALFVQYAFPAVFRSQDSTLEFINGGVLDQARFSSAFVDGTLSLDHSSSCSGFPIYFTGGVFREAGQDLVLTATLDSTETFSIRLIDGGRAGTLSTQHFYSRLYVEGADNRLYGRPVFNNPDPIRFNDFIVSTTLGIELEGSVSQDIILTTGSHLRLNDTLSLGAGYQINGEGIIDFNGNDLETGTTDTIWTGTIIFKDARNIVLNSNVTVDGIWTLRGDAVIIGNNNTLTIGENGLILLEPYVGLELNNLVIKGLQTGNFMATAVVRSPSLRDPLPPPPPGGGGGMDATATVSLFGVTIGLTEDTTIDNLTWYVNGPVKVITGDKFLTFTADAQLVVDADTLTYDTLNYKDQNNIQFYDRDTNLMLINGGSVRRAESLILGDYLIEQDTVLDRELIISSLRRLVVTQDAEIDGDGFYYQFQRDAVQPIFMTDPGVKVSFTNFLLRDFPLSTTSSRIRQGSELSFGPNVTLNLAQSGTLTTTWYVNGNVLLDGGGKTLAFGQNSAIVLNPGAQLTLDNITIRDPKSYRLYAKSADTSIILQNVSFDTDVFYSNTTIAYTVNGVFDLRGSGTFEHATGSSMTISNFGMLNLSGGTTFKYNPPTADRDLIILEDDDAVFSMDGASLVSSSTGMRLTKGTIVIAGSCRIFGSGSSDSSAITFGNGISSGDVTLDVAEGALLDIYDGRCLYANTQ